MKEWATEPLSGEKVKAKWSVWGERCFVLFCLSFTISVVPATGEEEGGPHWNSSHQVWSSKSRLWSINSVHSMFFQCSPVHTVWAGLDLDIAYLHFFPSLFQWRMSSFVPQFPLTNPLAHSLTTYLCKCLGPVHFLVNSNIVIVLKLLALLFKKCGSWLL